MQNEMYRVPLEPSTFAGYYFMSIANQIYKVFGIILFALEVVVNNETKVFLNPSDYLFEEYPHFGYVIAQQLPDFEAL